MWSRLMGLFCATTATLLVVGLGAAVIGPLVYFTLVFAEGLIETVGLVPRGWGAGHPAVFVWAAGILIGAAALRCGLWYFRRALEVEAELRRGGAPPTG